MFRRRESAGSPRDLFAQRVKQLVGETRARPVAVRTEGEAGAGELDVMAILVELRAAARRGNEPTVAKRLGPEFARYLGEFYNLPSEQQPSMLEALLQSRRLESESDLAAAVDVCDHALQSCPNYLPLLERVAVLETVRSNVPGAVRGYARLLAELDQLDLHARTLEICRELLDTSLDAPDLLEQCGRRLEAAGELGLAAHCWSTLASRLLADDRPDDALAQLDRALGLNPDSASLYYELGVIFEALGEKDRATTAFAQAESLAEGDVDTLGRLLLIRSRASRPDEELLGKLMDLLEDDPPARSGMLVECAGAIVDNPFNPHLRYVYGVLLAQDGQLDNGIAALSVAVDRYQMQLDQASELEVRQVLQRITPDDEANHRRVAALYFERGEVSLAMKALAGLARASRGSS